MSLYINCSSCDKELDTPGALMFGPPDDVITCSKWHFCVRCYHTIISNLLKQKYAEKEEIENES